VDFKYIEEVFVDNTGRKPADTRPQLLERVNRLIG